MEEKILGKLLESEGRTKYSCVMQRTRLHAVSKWVEVSTVTSLETTTTCAE